MAVKEIQHTIVISRLEVNRIKRFWEERVREFKSRKRVSKAIKSHTTQEPKKYAPILTEEKGKRTKSLVKVGEELMEIQSC